MVKNTPANAGDAALIPGSGRSPGEGNGNPLQYSYLENSANRGGLGRLQSMGVTKESDTTEQLNSNKMSQNILSATPKEEAI